MQGLAIDLFAGGGGASTGIEAALERPVDYAINHSAVAMAVHGANHPKTQHLTADLWLVRPEQVAGGEPVGFLWASPDCRHHSVAKGGKPRSQKVRALPWVVVRWAKAVRPTVIGLENVPEFQTWGPLDENGKPIKALKGQFFDRWRRALEAIGYVVEWKVLRCSEYGAPTKRRRLFLIARCDGLPVVWPSPTHGPGLAPFRTTADDCIDWSLPCPSIFARKKPLAEKTLWRIAQGLKRFVFENPRPFIVKVNHGKREPRHENIDEPLSTVTAQRRGHALILPVLQQSGYGERKGQRARSLDIKEPLGTAVNGQKHALVLAFLSRYFGDPLRTDGGGGKVVGAPMDEPLPTVTSRDHHALAAVTLATFRGTDPSQPGAHPVDAPLGTVSAGGIHAAQVCAFLTVYYGSDGTGGQELLEPMRTVTSKARFGIVTVEGVDYQITDIGFRMLEPHELLRAQFGKYADGYDLSKAKTKKDKIWLIGNSAPPEVVEALVRANMPRAEARAA